MMAALCTIANPYVFLFLIPEKSNLKELDDMLEDKHRWKKELSIKDESLESSTLSYTFCFPIDE